MSELKATPGPWEWHPCYDPSGKRLTSLDVSPANGHSLTGVAVIASVWGNEANARLIASAPELLSAAEEVLNPKASLNRALQRLRSVCAKARGEA